jgi:TRAP-type C4-dicarboxylate transport system permease large subunit
MQEAIHQLKVMQVDQQLLARLIMLVLAAAEQAKWEIQTQQVTAEMAQVLQLLAHQLHTLAEAAEAQDKIFH